ISCTSLPPRPAHESIPQSPQSSFRAPSLSHPASSTLHARSNSSLHTPAAALFPLAIQLPPQISCSLRQIQTHSVLHSNSHTSRPPPQAIPKPDRGEIQLRF